MDKDKIELLPTSAGIYLFKDLHNEVIYIGKAKSIRKRVRSYFRPNSDWKVELLVKEAADIAVVVTKTEAEALLLEAQMIQQHKPKFNVLLKSGQPFIYLLFTNEEPSRLVLTRNKVKKGVYFGPFLQKTDARRVYAYLIKTFQLMFCNKKIEGGCLDYHLGICPGSCRGGFDGVDYHFRIDLAKQALAGNHKDFLNSIKKQIDLYNEQLAFEKSRNLQDYMRNFETIFATLRVHFNENKYAHETAVATADKKYAASYSPNIAQQLQQFLQLERPPVTIDCFDISHFQSNSLVGACVRFVNGKPEKNKFRRFKIKTMSSQDDYACLQEIVARRYRNPDDVPDLILIDGGKGQLNAVQWLFESVPFIALAKKEETIFSNQFPGGLRLDVKTEVGRLLISLRDYTHHFAISYHRLLRSKARQK